MYVSKNTNINKTAQTTTSPICREALETARKENKTLRDELSMFDAGFFEELQQLKVRAAQVGAPYCTLATQDNHDGLRAKCARYETLLRELSLQLGRPPPGGVPVVAPDPADVAPLKTTLPTALLSAGDDTKPASPKSDEDDVGHAPVMADFFEKVVSTGASTAGGPSSSAPSRRLQPLKQQGQRQAPGGTDLEVVGRALPPPRHATGALEGKGAVTEKGALEGKGAVTGKGALEGKGSVKRSSWDALWSTLHALEDGADEP